MGSRMHAALAIVALCAPSISALAQPSEDAEREVAERDDTELGDTELEDAELEDAEFEDLEAFLDPSGTEWNLDDGVGTDAVPWRDVDPERSYLPIGQTHLGVQVRGAALLLDSAPYWATGVAMEHGPLIELAGILDHRWSRSTAWRIRCAIALSYQPHYERYLGAGTTQSSSPLALRFRVQPIAFDLGRYVSIRLGGDLGMQWSPTFAGAMRTDFFGAATGDLVVLLLDGLIEIGLTSGLQFTANVEDTRSNTSVALSPQVVLGATAAYLLP